MTKLASKVLNKFDDENLLIDQQVEALEKLWLREYLAVADSVDQCSVDDSDSPWWQDR